MARKKSAAKKAREAQEAQEKPTPREVPQPEKPVLESLSESGEEDSSESEDEYGELLNDKVDEGINKILQTLKEDPKKLLDKDVTFFGDAEETHKAKKDKPLYLKDYHRMNLLGQYDTVDGEKPFVVEEQEQRDQILADIQNAISDDDDDDFLQRKAPAKREEPTVLPNAENETEFLQSFLDKKAWIPTKRDQTVHIDDDDDEFDEAAEKFENAYNFRYEDPTSAEIISYARTQATLRRDKQNSRKRQREKEHEEKQKERQEKEKLIKKKETAKLNKVTDRLLEIRQAVGEDVSEELIKRVFGDSLLEDDFDDADWDAKMAQIFDEAFYGGEPEKPKGLEDLGELVGEDEEMSDEEPEAAELEPEAAEPEKKKLKKEGEKKSKKDKLKEKKKAKKEKDALKETAKALVDASKAKIIEEVEEERGRKHEDVKFTYREVSPESFGLSTREIFAADDKALNNYIGIKKFAPYRPKELRVKDRRKYKKKRPLQEWRKETFKGKDPEEVLRKQMK